MKNRIFLFLFSILLLASCTKGSEGLERVAGSSFSVKSEILDTESEEICGDIFGLYQDKLNTLTLDISWENLSFDIDPLISIEFRSKNNETIRKIDYSSNSEVGKFSLVFSGYNAFKKEEIQKLLSNELFIVMCTKNLPEGIAKGGLKVEKQN